MSRENVGKLISSVVALGFVAAAVVLIVTDNLGDGRTLLGVGLALGGAIGTLGLPRLREPSATQDGGSPSD